MSENSLTIGGVIIKGFPSRRDSIVLAAIDIISESGIQGLSTKEIAAKQEISESVLYKHFKSLDEVLVCVIDHFSLFDDMIINTVLKRDISSKEKILEYTKAFVELYESYPALGAIILNYETLMHYNHTREIVIQIINKRTDIVAKVISIGQSAGEIEYYYSAQELTDIIMGVISNMILRWKMSGYNYKLKENIIVTLKKILDRC